MAARWLDDREAQAWHGFQRVHRRLEVELAHQLECDTRLSLPEYEVLAVLTAAPDGLRGFELAEELGWDKTRLSHRIKAMEAAGLVARRTCPEDRRGYVVTATARGRAAITEAAPGHVAAVRRLFIDLLDEHELDVLGGVMTRVLAHLTSSAP